MAKISATISWSVNIHYANGTTNTECPVNGAAIVFIVDL